MPTREELNLNGIYEWETVKDKYKNPSLLLGNGFSMMFSQNFSYNSLFDIFLQNTNDQFRELFSHFDTTNFELIQKYLTYSLKVNSILGLPTEVIVQAIDELKNGLIRTIEQVHPRCSEINFTQLHYIAQQLKDFGDIYTTNYDMYLYHIIMLSNDIARVKKDYIAYQDWFWGRNNAPQGFLEFMTTQDYEYKHIFYLHGSLFIFNRGVLNIMLKRESANAELINLIANQIRNDSFPVFITEGSGAQKLEGINNNNYLYFCLKKLKSSSSPIMIFGNAMGEFDNHILDAIKERPRDIIY
ncbi:DUF4917 family protein [Pontibacter sp. E15-1]|uniref:DUF4917 family protein n=1 Tax=Pontibacter sp. E15-1 TaxID=2919918 RepID=UPI001F4F4E26|nr:DUF4917 family protein [Pontibacter sp. E15-1]MCJ8166197.1 DUF4917 family protein [Pontibacter sp. E15-1]